MGRIQDWIARRDAARRKASQETYWNENYQKLVENLGNHDHVTRNVERDIRRRYAAYGEVLQEVEDFEEALETVRSEQTRDLKSEALGYRQINTQWVEWCKHILLNRIKALEFDEFNEVTAGRAVVILLSYMTRYTWDYEEHHTFMLNGRRLLAGLYADDEQDQLPSQAEVQQFVESGGLEESNYEKFLAKLYGEVKGSRRAVSKVLAEYGQVVRDTWYVDETPDDTPLPDDEIPKGTVVTWDTLVKFLSKSSHDGGQDYYDKELSHGISLYVDGKSLRESANTSGVREEVLRNELSRLDLLRTPGRPRKRK